MRAIRHGRRQISGADRPVKTSGGALRRIRGRQLLAGASGAAIACLLPGQASGATYMVSNEAQLIAAINSANADGDPSSSIVMTQSFNIQAPHTLPIPTKSLSVDTQGFTLSGTSAPGLGGTVRFSGGTFASGTLTLSGTLTGANQGGGMPAGVGLVVDSGISTWGSPTGQVVNNGSITAGSATVSGANGSIGVTLLNVVTFVNNGTVTGGSGINGAVVGNNGAGVSANNTGATIINNASGIIQGGNSQGGYAGAGVWVVGSAAKPATVVNHGTIRGGSDLTGVGTGNYAIRSRGTNISITNYGTLEGGNGVAAIGPDGGFPFPVTVVNSGTIRAGTGSTTAIQFANNVASNSTLELQAGSQIIGNVIAGILSTSDTLRLGGDGFAILDGAIGATGQYRNFDILQKTGTGTWALTVDNTAIQDWTISQGTLQIGNGGTTGSILGNVTNNGTLAFDRSDAYTYAGTISGSGGVSQIGTGTTVLSGANSYSGGTTMSNGVLSVAADTNLGDAAGGLTFNGGVLQVTGQSYTGTNRAITWGPLGGGFDIVDAGNHFAVSQAIIGGGPLSKLGAGTLILTGDNNYGGTTISAGTLQLGNGGTTGSITGNVTNNGILTFDRSNDMNHAGAISGSGAVIQQGAGSTTLTGANTYSGGTTISAGTLIGQASSFGTGNILDDAALVFDQSTNASFAAAIDGTGTLTKRGLGNLNLTGTNTLSGATTIEAGTLSVNGSLADSAVTILSGGTLGGNGTVGNTTLQADGVIAPGNSIGQLTIQGNFVGAGGTVEIEAILDGDASSTDKLIITGDTSGTANVKVIGLGGAGAQTVEGIKIIDVGGVSAGTFNLQGDYVFQGDQAVVAGAYAYRLYQNGISTPADGDWYLRSALINPVDPGGPTSPLYSPAVPVYEAYAGVLQSFTQLGTLQQRIGNRSWTVADQSATGGANQGGSPIWGRMEASHSEFEPGTSTTGTDYDADLWRLQAGLDVLLSETASGTLIGGVTVHYSTVRSNVSSAFGVGSIDTTGYGFGGTLTWYGKNGLYIDTQAELSWFDSDLSSATLGTKLADGNNGFGYGLGIETGRKVALHGNWSLTPQAQLSYASVDFDNFTDPYGALVSNDGSDSLVGRLGLSADYESEWKGQTGQSSRSHVYGIANLYYDFLDGSDVDVSGTRLVSQTRPLWGGLGLGGSLSWADDRYSVHGELLARTSLEDFGDSDAFGGTVGFKMRW
ncbi:autotransporter outer membrane beta-barrel domain-containing protein [Mesorhizobium sp. M4B.F.Ca.ET.049.02.1.2]|nr:autotransporter outer membrane beta-barrel domain-containing protein [Mesorhizobium sp. M4B.F.Ca.ET.049.02.1.2]